MKNITNLIFTVLFTAFFALSNAQGINVQGSFENNGSPVVGLGILIDYGDGLDSLYTNTSGAFYGGPYNVSGSQGSVELTFLDCNNNLTTITGFWNPGLSVIDFGIIDFCPSNIYSATANFSLEHVNSPVAINVSWDGGSSYSVINTNSFGAGSSILTAIPNANSGTFMFNFLDCNGNTISGSDTYDQNNNDLSFNEDYCPVICSAGFTLSQQTSQNQGGPITSTGPITVNNNSTGSNLTYTWDFGDGSATYTGVNFTHTYVSAGPYSLCLTIDNGNGCTDTYCDSLMVNSNGVLTGKVNNGFTIQMGDASDDTNGPTGINTLEENVSIAIFPNPVSNYINLIMKSNISEIATIVIFDLTGKAIQENNIEISNGNQEINIELVNINKGLYIMHLITQEGTISQKLTVK